MRDLAFSFYLRAFAAETRRARAERGYSRAELARRAGLHENILGALERGERDLNCITQTRLLAALGCDGVHVGAEGVRFSLSGISGGVRGVQLLEAPAAAVVQAMGASIRARRTELRFSLEDVARSAGIHRNTIWNFEQGLVVPQGYTVFALFRALELPIAQPETLRP